jgi:hypothetical protein
MNVTFDGLTDATGRIIVAQLLLELRLPLAPPRSASIEGRSGARAGATLSDAEGCDGR